MDGQDSGGHVRGSQMTAHNRSDSQETTSGVQTDKLEETRAVAAAAAAAGTRPKSKCAVTSTTQRRLSELPTIPRDGSSRRSSRASRRTLDPPVTKATLSELDVNKIIHNPKLRHDINFDPELHFRPNLDGEKGRRKQDKANQFWATLRAQLILFVTERERFDREVGQSSEWCLPALLIAVHDIIQTLVPQRDRELLNEGLNVELIMQQFYRGSADLEKLAGWLSGVLKLHCAPMRDEWVDEMFQELSSGNRNNDIAELVKGLRSLLSILEAMKLDVANHQIRCLRPVLIEETVAFERRFFERKIQSGRLDVTAAHQWYRDTVDEFYDKPCEYCTHTSFGETAAFFQGLTKLIMPSTAKGTIPNTFLFDEERLVKLRSDLLDAVNLELCMRIYEDLDGVPRFSAIPQANAVRSSVPAYLVDDDAASLHSNSSDGHSSNGSRPSSLALSSCGSMESSTRTSAMMLPLESRNEAAEAKAKSQIVYDSLLALLQTAPAAASPRQRWEGLVPAIAIQIFRCTNMPHDMLPRFEESLAQALCDVHSDSYTKVEDLFQQRILEALGRRVPMMRNLSGMMLFQLTTTLTARNASRRCGSRGVVNGAAGGIARTAEIPRELAGLVTEAFPTREGRDDGGVEDMALRMAHLGELHWRVWAPTVYLTDHEMTDVECSSSASSGHSTPDCPSPAAVEP